MSDSSGMRSNDGCRIDAGSGTGPGTLPFAAVRGVSGECPPLLEVRGLTRRYLGLTALADFSYSVGRGEIVGLIGPNGSGKSTNVDLVSGFQTADGGEWSLDGVALTGLAAHQIARAGLIRSFQNVRAYDELSLVENLCVASQSGDGVGWIGALLASVRLHAVERDATSRAHELLALVGLTEHAAAPALALSYGQRKLLAIAAAMMTRPKLLILDEPVAGVNPTMIRRIEQAIRTVNGQGVAVLLIEHNVDFVMKLCRRVVVLEAGRKIAEGPPAQIRRDPRVLAAYLGAAYAGTMPGESGSAAVRVAARVPARAPQGTPSGTTSGTN